MPTVVATELVSAGRCSEMDETDLQADSAVTEHEVCVSEELSSVSKSNMEAVITKVAQILDAQGISCFRCPKSIYKLYPLSDTCRGEYISHIEKGTVRFGMTVSCGEDKPVYTFELTLFPIENDKEVPGHEKESGRKEHCR